MTGLAGAKHDSFPGCSNTTTCMRISHLPRTILAVASLGLQATGADAPAWARVDQPLVIPADRAPKLGSGDFSITVWAKADVTDRVMGDLASQIPSPETPGLSPHAEVQSRQHLESGELAAPAVRHR